MTATFVLQGGGVDYDIPRSDPQNRQLPPLPPHSNAVLKKEGTETAVRELLYDIPKSLEKTKLHSGPPLSHPNHTSANLFHKSKSSNELSVGTSVYDTPKPTAQFLVTPPGLIPQRNSGPMSPLCKSGDSAVDMTSNRSSMMSNTSSPPGSSVCDSSSEFSSEIYDTPNSIKAVANKRQVLTRMHQKLSESQLAKHIQATEGCYDVPRALQEVSGDYRDSGIYDNARLSTIQNSPGQEMNLYDSPSSKTLPIKTKGQQGGAPVYDVLPTHSKRQELPKRTDSALISKSTQNSIDLDDIEKLTLTLDEAIEIIVKLQQHVNTSTTRLLSFVHAKWRVKSNLEAVLYDLKLACVGLQSTLQEFYDFGTGALANSATLTDNMVMSRLSLVLVPLKQKLNTVNDSMKVRIQWVGRYCLTKSIFDLLVHC